ncbi:uncharacterized protein LOC144660724 isoform X1 [Oculina patagonica]
MWKTMFSLQSDDSERPFISNMTVSNFLRQFLLLAYLGLAIKGCRHKSLEFEHRSTSLVKGCYCHNESLSLCFEIQPELIQLTDKKKNLLVRYRKLASQRFYVQVMGDNFLWPHPAAEPLFISTAREETNSGTEDPILEGRAGLTGENGQSSPVLYQRAIEKLRRKREMQLLDRVSLALHNRAKQYPITKAFHVMSMSLLAERGPNTPARDTETADYKTHKYLTLFGKRRDNCEDLRGDPNKNDCLGMCGPKCWCWKAICDDCCFHQGCYEHDLCCRGKRKFSSYCLLPFFHNFGCDSFGGYPDCL